MNPHPRDASTQANPSERAPECTKLHNPAGAHGGRGTHRYLHSPSPSITAPRASSPAIQIPVPCLPFAALHPLHIGLQCSSARTRPFCFTSCHRISAKRPAVVPIFAGPSLEAKGSTQRITRIRDVCSSNIISPRRAISLFSSAKCADLVSEQSTNQSCPRKGPGGLSHHWVGFCDINVQASLIEKVRVTW